MDASDTRSGQQMLMEASAMSLVGVQVQTPLCEADIQHRHQHQQQQQQRGTLCPRTLGLPASAGPEAADGLPEMTGSPSDSCYSDDKMNSPARQAQSYIYGPEQQLQNQNQNQNQHHKQQPYLCPLQPLDATDMDASAAACPPALHSLHTSAPAAAAAASSLYSCVPISPPLDPSDTVLDGGLENGSMAASFASPTPPFPTTPLSTPLGFEHQSTTLQIPTSAEANYCSFAITTLPSQAPSSFTSTATLPPTSVPSCNDNMTTDRFHRASPFAGSTGSSTGDEGYLSNDHGSEQHSRSSSPRAEEPYAQLIYKAFMSEPTRSMTLQQIYQWFRDNTNKAVNGDKGGWMNSIRHNLSMNKAFIKREKLAMDQAGHMQPLSDSKRSTEWVLQDWAATNGVESTTRYRPKTTAAARRAAAPRRGQADYGRRANASGARGGGIAGRRTGCGLVGGPGGVGVGGRMGRRGASPRYGQSVEATTPPTHPMLHPSAYEYHDQAELSDFHHHHHHHHHSMEDSPGSSPGRHHYSTQHHHLGGSQLGGYHHQSTTWDVYPSPPTYQMSAPAPHQAPHHQHPQQQQSPVDYAYSLSSQQMDHDQQQQASFRPADSPAFTPEGLFPQDGLCDLNRGGLWSAGGPKE